jgi:hypothetical protein
VVELENLLESTMEPRLFHSIRQPVLNLYYFRDQANQDNTIRVSAILDMHKQLGTPAGLKEAVAIPNANAHVIGCKMTSADIPAVEKAIDAFAENKLGLVRVK